MPNHLSALEKTIADNLAEISGAIKSNSEKDVCLVAVSKGQSFDSIAAAYKLGHRHFGESYAQEFLTKRNQAQQAGLSEIKWHFIGAIQSNKIKVISLADYVHSVASIKHAKGLSQQMHGGELKIFLQINLTRHDARSGFLVSEINEAAQAITLLPHLSLVGLMAILPVDSDAPHDFWFKKMVTMRDSLAQSMKIPSLKLSMGMSGDFICALRNGADFIRIGSKIFGPRSRR